MHALPNRFEQLEEQPVERIEETKRGYYRSVLLEKVGTCIPQHTHSWAHDTLVCAGRARGWCDGVWIGDKGPGEAFEIEAEKAHVFMALEPMTRLACVHNLNGEPYRMLAESKLEVA